MTLFLFLVWLQMSAPTMPCQSAKLYSGGVLVDEEPHCGFLLQPINMPTALDDMTRAEFAESAQRAADETDGKPGAHIYLYPVQPVDVPAVQVGERLSYDCGQGIACIDHYVPVYSCKDKSRILEHDENSPAKYWCRKVQP